MGRACIALRRCAACRVVRCGEDGHRLVAHLTLEAVLRRLVTPDQKLELLGLHATLQLFCHTTCSSRGRDAWAGWNAAAEPAAAHAGEPPAATAKQQKACMRHRDGGMHEVEVDRHQAEEPEGSYPAPAASWGCRDRGQWPRGRPTANAPTARSHPYRSGAGSFLAAVSGGSSRSHLRRHMSCLSPHTCAYMLCSRHVLPAPAIPCT